MTSIRVAASPGARARRSSAILWLTAITASASASVACFRARFARMYGMSGSASGHATPARGRTHRVMFAAVHSGQSNNPLRVLIRSDQ